MRWQLRCCCFLFRGRLPVLLLPTGEGNRLLQYDTKQNKAAKGSNTEIKNKKNSGTQVSQGNKTDTKRGVKTKQTAAAKRNLNAIYILPKGYKDITIKGKAEATKKQAAQLIVAKPVLGRSGTGRHPSGHGLIPGFAGDRLL